jgi:hypothetical protein
MAIFSNLFPYELQLDNRLDPRLSGLPGLLLDLLLLGTCGILIKSDPLFSLDLTGELYNVTFLESSSRFI